MTLHLLHTLVIIAVLGVGAQWLAWRLHLPAIVLLVAAGLLAGPALGLVQPTRDLGALLPAVVKLGVAVILFEGGLNLRLHEFKQAAHGVRRLVFPGVVVSWTAGSALAHYVGGLSWPVSLLFGAIVIVTGPTVIIPLLRHARLKRRPASFLKWEGIINDPIGALLAVLVFEYFVVVGGGGTFSDQLWHMALALVVAAGLGAGAAWLLGRLFLSGQVPEYLKPPVMFAAVLAVYGVSDLLQDEAGLLATTIMGLVIGNLRLPSIAELRRFKEYITILLVSAVFILLTADLDPATLRQLDWRSAWLLAAILFIARPVTVLLSTLGTDMSWRERGLVAWIAPRGIVAAAVAGVFGPRLVELGYADAHLLLPLVFTLIVVTVLVHGFSLQWLARALDLASTARNGVLIVGASPWTTALAGQLRELEVPVLLVDSSWQRLRPARLEGIPTYFGEILSESAEETLELIDIGYLLAATDNDAYNALVCTRFAHELERNRIYQLPTAAVSEEDPRALARTMRGNIAFDEHAQYWALLRRLHQGWEFQRTRFTETYSYDQYQSDSPRQAIAVLLLRGESRELVFQSTTTPLEPGPDDVLITFTPVDTMDKAREVASKKPATATEHREDAGE